jgi:hypothetical protein
MITWTPLKLNKTKSVIIATIINTITPIYHGNLHAANCPHTFSGQYTITKAATCTTNGTEVAKCTKCHTIIATRTIPAEGHKFNGSYTITKAATCTTDGTEVAKCTRCHTITATRTIPAEGHKFNDSYTITKAATCTTNGTKVGKCTKCQAILLVTQIPELGHSYGSWKVTKEATHTQAGTKKRTCTRSGCNSYEKEPIPATGHKPTESRTLTKEPKRCEKGP